MTLVDFSEGGHPPQLPKGKRTFVYRCRLDANDLPENVLHYVRIEKFNDTDTIRQFPLETYRVTIYKPECVSHEELSVMCSCPGFTIQRYSKLLHKHVVAAKTFLSQEGQPEEFLFIFGENNAVTKITP